MAAHAAVGVDDDLTAGHAAVAIRAADDESARRIDVKFGIRVDHVGRNQFVDDRRLYQAPQFLDRHVLMLRGNDDCIDAGGLAVDVLHRDLTLAVGTEVFCVATPASLAQPPCEPVRQHDRQRHQFRGFVTGIAEHQTLVAGATRVHSHRDVTGLRVHEIVKLARFGVETDLWIGVPDLLDGFARDGLIVDLGGRRNLAGDDATIGGHQGFTGNAAHRVLRQGRIKNRIADLIANFIRVPFRHGLGSENMSAGVGQFSPPLLFGIPRVLEAQRPPRGPTDRSSRRWALMLVYRGTQQRVKPRQSKGVLTLPMVWSPGRMECRKAGGAGGTAGQ